VRANCTGMGRSLSHCHSLALSLTLWLILLLAVVNFVVNFDEVHHFEFNRAITFSICLDFVVNGSFSRSLVRSLCYLRFAFEQNINKNY